MSYPSVWDFLELKKADPLWGERATKQAATDSVENGKDVLDIIQAIEKDGKEVKDE